MPTKHLHIMGIDGGGTTAWGLLTVPRASIFGDEPSAILEWDFGEFMGPEPKQAINLARLVREVQSLDYKTGVAIMSEAWTFDPTFKNADADQYSPIRINAMLLLLQEQKLLGDATIHLQQRGTAKETATDYRLKQWGLYVPGSDHIRDAIRHAITGLRRAAENPEFAKELWPY